MRIIISILSILLGSTVYTQQNLALRPNESQINFSVDHLGWAEAEGNFKAKSGNLYLDKNGKLDSVIVVVGCKSVNTGIEMRDENLRGHDWLDCPQYPEIKYHARRIFKTPSGYDVQGILQIKGVKHKVIIPIQVEENGGQIRLNSFIEIDRYEYGVGGSSGFPAGREIKGDISLVFEKN